MSKTGTKISLRNNGFIVAVSSIMAGDSPTSDYKDPVFALPPSAGGRSTPPPTTSYFSAKQENPAVATEIVPDLSRKDEIDGHKEQLEVLPEGANLGYKMDDGGGRRIDKDRDHGGHNDKETSKLNGYGDGLDGQWIPSNAVGKNLPKKEEDDEEDETCVVNCLYYTMQCCECTIS